MPLFYSREARMYALVSALGLVCLWLFLGGVGATETGTETGTKTKKHDYPIRRFHVRRADPFIAGVEVPTS